MFLFSKPCHVLNMFLTVWPYFILEIKLTHLYQQYAARARPAIAATQHPATTASEQIK